MTRPRSCGTLRAKYPKDAAVREGLRCRARRAPAAAARAREALTAVRIGILGGTFDPPHVGHLLAASDAYEALALDRLLFVPAARQPFKGEAVGASPEQRAAMLELMVAGDPRFAVDRSEMEREGLSYTVDTLAGAHGAPRRGPRCSC